MLKGAPMNLDPPHIAGHIASLVAILAALAGWLPGIAAMLAIVWYLIQLYESKTTQRWLAARRARKVRRLLAVIEKTQAVDRAMIQRKVDDRADKADDVAAGV